MRKGSGVEGKKWERHRQGREGIRSWELCMNEWSVGRKDIERRKE